MEASTNESGESGSGQAVEKCYMQLTEVANYHKGYRKCHSETTSSYYHPCANLTNGHTPSNLKKCNLGS
jgi:hypothetical protein